MSKKVELLTSLREYVSQGKNIPYEYVSYEHGEEACYCALGFMGKQLGIEDEVMKKQNTDTISVRDDLLKSFFEVGFTRTELKLIQEINDASLGNDPEVLNFLIRDGILEEGEEPDLIKCIDKIIDAS